MTFRQLHEMTHDELVMLAEQGDIQAREALDLRISLLEAADRGGKVAARREAEAKQVSLVVGDTVLVENKLSRYHKCIGEVMRLGTVLDGVAFEGMVGVMTSRHGSTPELQWFKPESLKRCNNPVKHVGTIDLTPTWKGVLPIIIAALIDGTPESAKIAREELATMAKAADLYNASVKK